MYVYLAALQTPVLPPKPQKDAYFFLGHPEDFCQLLRMVKSTSHQYLNQQAENEKKIEYLTLWNF